MNIIIDLLKELFSIAKKTGNIELNMKLIDLNEKIVELQSEMSRLQKENDDLNKQISTESDIEYHEDPYLTRKIDEKPIKYCAACWASEKILVPIQALDNYAYRCPHCNVRILITAKRKQLIRGNLFI